MTTDETKTVKPTFKQRVYRQFGKPTGFWGGERPVASNIAV